MRTVEATDPASARSIPAVEGPDALDLLARGDRRAALQVLMAEHGDAILGLCIRILRDRALAEDILQQVFLEAYRDLDRFQGRSSLRTWLFGIASHRCQDAIKSRRRRELRIEADEAAVVEFVDPTGGPTDQLDRSRLAAALEECLRSLSQEVRMSVLLRFQAGMSYEQMSSSMNAKADTLQARVSRALPILRRCLEGKGWTGE
jgi:RNA polymerase sigma-70 factor (ECF subfamily)